MRERKMTQQIFNMYLVLTRDNPCVSGLIFYALGLGVSLTVQDAVDILDAGQV